MDYNNKQSYDEIILVDSGSTDDTLLIASSYDVLIEKYQKINLLLKSFKYWMQKSE